MDEIYTCELCGDDSVPRICTRCEALLEAQIQKLATLDSREVSR